MGARFRERVVLSGAAGATGFSRDLPFPEGLPSWVWSQAVGCGWLALSSRRLVEPRHLAGPRPMHLWRR